MGKRRGSGDGSIYQRKDGRWTGVLDLGWVKGRRVRKYLYGRTRAEARVKLRAAQTRHDAGLAVLDDRQLLSVFLHMWLVEVVKPSVRQRTLGSYTQIVDHHIVPALGDVRLAALTPKHIQGLISRSLEAGLSARTVEYIWRVLRRALKVAVVWGLVTRNVAELVSPPRTTHKEITALNIEELKRILGGAADDRLEAAFVLAVTSGLRRGEILGLHSDDIDLESTPPVLRVRRTLQRIDGHLVEGEPKSQKSRRTIVLSSIAGDAIRRHRVRQPSERLLAGPSWQNTEYLFTTPLGTAVDPRNFLRCWHRLLAGVGLEVRPLHDARHAAASLMFSQGVPLKVAQDTLGHSTIRLTADLYGHLFPGDAERAAEAVERALA